MLHIGSYVVPVRALSKVEQLANMVRAFGTTHVGHLLIGETGKLTLTHLDNGEVEHGQFGGDNAPAARLATTLAITATHTAEAAGVARHQQTEAGLGEHTLLHREPLLVAYAHYLEDVSLEFLTEGITGHLMRNALLVETRAKLAVIFDAKLLLARSQSLG
jgi:hypothetical protein